jgi:hypothetical protein
MGAIPFFSIAAVFIDIKPARIRIGAETCLQIKGSSKVSRLQGGMQRVRVICLC